MKKYILASLLLAVLTVGCEKKLDVLPTQSIDQENALLTEGDILVTLVGCYDGMQGAATYGGDIMVLNELIGNSDDIRFTGTFAGLSDAYRLEMTNTNTFARDTWIGAYNTINRCNNVLSAIDRITSSATLKARVEGEALFIRSTMYFELVCLFAKTWGDGDNATNPGVPLVLTPTAGVTDADYKARSSVAEVYNQVKTDLTRAESLLPASNGIFATKNAALAILSRVALMQGDYAAARDYANTVIASGRHTLATTFDGAWFTFINNTGNSPSEYVFSMKVTAQDGTNSLNTYFGINAGAGTAGRGDCKIQNAHLAKYEAGDARGTYFTVVGGNNYTRKHLDRYGNVAVVRLAELYLTRAEANFRLGTEVGDTPLNDVNRIRTRSSLTGLGTVTLADILKERYLETAFEGNRLHDIKRTRGTQSGTAWNSPKLILPIPQREIDVNKNLVQNEGYF
ncbi:MAG TPA: RagB/SusD family nutrient uptake outer membrane protein [Ferruginibacter sp.]|nr:RagB/SusD family nutrient uptake outer membrane protein [Ferruginibacter sp.]HMP20731.1 RagB/SusD family nutrient uptake outer membrane protein [Ferruginibacter sp.]